MAKFEDARLIFIQKYEVKMKKEFWQPPDIEVDEVGLKEGQIIPILEVYEIPNVYNYRKMKDHVDCDTHGNEVEEEEEP